MTKGAVVIIVSLGIFLASWEIVGSLSQKFVFFASKPSVFLPVWGSELLNADYWNNFLSTLVALFLGYLVAILSGYILGISTYSLKKRNVDLEVLLLVLGSIPVFALAPLLILAMGNGLSVRVTVVTLSSVFLVASGVFNAVKFADEEFGSIARDLNYDNSILWKRFLLPGGVIYSIPSLKGAVALSLIGVFVAEWISSQNGLGRYILSAMGLYDSARLIIGIGSFMAISSVAMILISVAEARTSKWRNFR